MWHVCCMYTHYTWHCRHAVCNPFHYIQCFFPFPTLPLFYCALSAFAVCQTVTSILWPSIVWRPLLAPSPSTWMPLSRRTKHRLASTRPSASICNAHRNWANQVSQLKSFIRIILYNTYKFKEKRRKNFNSQICKVKKCVEIKKNIWNSQLVTPAALIIVIIIKKWQNRLLSLSLSLFVLHISIY